MSNQRMCWQGQNKGIQSKACKLEPSLSNSISSNHQTSHKYFEPSKGKFSSLFGMWFANWTKKKKWKGLIGLNWPVEIGFTFNNAHHQFGTTLCVYIKIPGLKHVPSTKACFCAHYRIKCYPIGILENSLKLVFLFFFFFSPAYLQSRLYWHSNSNQLCHEASPKSQIHQMPESCGK